MNEILIELGEVSEETKGCTGAPFEGSQALERDPEAHEVPPNC